MIIRATAPTKALMPNPDSSIKKHLIYTKNQHPLRCRIPPFDKNCPLKFIEIYKILAFVAARAQTAFFGLIIIKNIQPACKIPIVKTFMSVGLLIPVTTFK